jgi:hypothetical protein
MPELCDRTDGLEDVLLTGDPDEVFHHAAKCSQCRTELLDRSLYPAGCQEPRLGYLILCHLDELVVGLEEQSADPDGLLQTLRAHAEGCGACSTELDELAACGDELTWEAEESVEREAPSIVVSCVVCRGKLVRGHAVYCAACLAPHHLPCFEWHGRCAVMGCAEERFVRPEAPRPLEARLPVRVHSDPRREPEVPSQPLPARRRVRSGRLIALATLCAVGAGVAALSADLESSRALEPAGGPSAQAPVMEWREVAVQAQVQGAPAEGHVVGAVSWGPEVVWVHGPRRLLDANPGPYPSLVDVSGRTDGWRGTFEVTCPPGIACRARVQVEVEIAPRGGPAVAVVHGPLGPSRISAADLEDACRLDPHYRDLPPGEGHARLRLQVEELERMVEEVVLAEHARAAGLTDADVAAEVAARVEEAARSHGGVDGLRRTWEDLGTSLEAWRARLERRALGARLIGRRVDSDDEVTPEDVRRYYAQHPELARGGEGETRLREILVHPWPETSDRLPPALDDYLQTQGHWDPREYMDLLRSRLLLGDPFDVVAQGGSMGQGGLAVFPHADAGAFLVSPLAEAVNALEPGDVTPVIEVYTGTLHVIQLVARRPGGVRSLEEATPLIRERLRIERYREDVREYAARLRARTPVETFPSSLGARRSRVDPGDSGR